MLVLEPAHKQLILIDIADGSCPVVLDTVFSGPLRPAWRIKQLYDRTSPLRLPATTDCFIYLLTEKASFASRLMRKGELVEISAQ